MPDAKTRVIFSLHCALASADEFTEVAKLCGQMASHYAKDEKGNCYVITISNDPSGGFVGQGIRTDPESWQVVFSRGGTPEAKEKNN